MSNTTVRERLKDTLASWEITRRPFEKPVWEMIGPLSPEDEAYFRAHDEEESRTWWSSPTSDIALLLMDKARLALAAEEAGISADELKEERRRLDAEIGEHLQEIRATWRDIGVFDEGILSILRSSWRLPNPRV